MVVGPGQTARHSWRFGLSCLKLRRLLREQSLQVGQPCLRDLQCIARLGRISYGNPIGLYEPIPSGRPDNYEYTGDSRYEFETTGLYLQDEISWNRWRVLLGGRQEWTDTLSFYTGGVDPAVTRSDSPFSPRAGVTFLAKPDLSFYASWARSFRNKADVGMLESGLTPKPTRGEQVEVGAKSILLDGRIETTLALFDLRKQDAVTDPSTGIS